MQQLLRSVSVTLVALALLVQPAFALRLSCAAVGKLFPASCCCTELPEIPRALERCCAEPTHEPAHDQPGARVVSERACACGLELPEPPTLAPHATERDAAPAKSVAASDGGGERASFGLSCEHASGVVALSWSRASLHDPGGAPRATSGAPRAFARAFGARASSIALRNARC